MKYKLTEQAKEWLREQVAILNVGGTLAYPRSGLMYTKDDETTLRLTDIVDPDDPAARNVSRSNRDLDREGTIVTGKAIGIKVIDDLPGHP